MAFDGRYLEWNQKRIKGIIDFYSHKFFFYKKICDLGCGYGDISASLLRLGADITAIDARQEHLKIINKKYPEIKTIKADLDKGLPSLNKKFDLILDLDLICHISNYEQHLKQVCSITTHLILETAVCDSEEPDKCVMIAENKNNYDAAFNGNGSRPSVAAIERVLKECGMDFRRMDNSKFNSGTYKYDWQAKNNGECNINNRRIWFCAKNDSAIKLAPIQNVQHKKPENPPNFSFNQVIPTYNTHGSHNFKQKNILSTHNKKFVIVIPSYNNIKYCDKNINSALNQDYSNYRIIFVDDCSNDGTFNKVQEIVNSSGKSNICTLVKNTKRVGALENLYNMIHSCEDDEIILTLDGDDWFPHDQVLNKLKVYYSEDVWMTYGQYQNSNDGGRGVAQEYPTNIINSNGFRNYTWGASHLRTFYAWLFKNIKKEDLLYNGQFMKMTWDLATMLPMLEMAGNRSKFILEIMYIYNMDNPINDHKVDRSLQAMLDKYVRAKPKYKKIENAPIFKKNIGLMFIATGKYDQFLQPIIDSADKRFLVNQNVKYYIFTDKQNLNIQTNRKYEIINIEHKTFPFATLDRFKHFTNAKEKLKNQDYLFYCDVDSLFIEDINEEILGNLVGVQHCGYFNQIGPIETNSNSTAYIAPDKRKIYFGGGFSGGIAESYLKLAEICYNNIEQDLKNNIIAIWHDESHINKYFSENTPDKILSPSYHYPQSNIEHYKKIWGGQNFAQKILLLDKKHNEVR